MYEIENGGHGAAEASAGLVHEKMLEWMNYLLLDNMSYCDSLIMMPENASQYLTTLECSESISYDVNNDGLINSSDLTSLMIYILYHNESFSPIDLNLDLNIDVMDILMFSDFLNEMN